MAVDHSDPIENIKERSQKLKIVPATKVKKALDNSFYGKKPKAATWTIAMYDVQGSLNFYGRYGAAGLYWTRNDSEALGFENVEDAMNIIKAMGWNQNVRAYISIPVEIVRE